MGKAKTELEIYEDDPFGSTCCGPGPQVTSLETIEKIRKMLEERSEIVKKLTEEHKDSVTIRRDTINQKTGLPGVCDEADVGQQTDTIRIHRR